MEPSLFFTWLAVCLAAHAVRTTYEVFKHRKVIRASRITFAVIFPTMVALWASWMMACESDIIPLAVPDGLRYAGLALCIAGVAIFLIALLTIKALESYEGDLITSGIYSYVRHPMYLSFILWLVGMPLFAAGGITLALAIPFIANVLFWRNLEEKELEKRFPEYPAYRQKTRF